MKSGIRRKFLIETKHVELLHQPETSIANRLLEEVTNANPPFKILRILSAYASMNGVDVLEAILKRLFVKRRLARAFVSIGIDRKRTSYDALNRLLQLKGTFTDLHVYVVHDKRSNYTFHPKMYNFESRSVALILVGSSNLTRAGLASNYEIVTAFTVDLHGSARNGYNDFMKSIKPYFAPALGGWVQELTYDLLLHLNNEGWLTREDVETKRDKSISKIFGRGSVEAAANTGVNFTRFVSKAKRRAPQIALQLTHWDTDKRHSETQIPEDVLNNGFFPKNNLTLVFPDGTERKTKLSHYEYHSRIYNKRILDIMRPNEGDVLMITRISSKKFRIRLIRKNKLTTNLLGKMTEKRGKGKRWGWV
jgi:HKD family nuclease